jgi:hypothetical protein
MALITCTECGSRLSDKAKSCPECGCPIDYIIKETSNENICIECGFNIPNKIKTSCPECGFPLEIVDNASSNHDLATTKSTDIIDLTQHDVVNDVSINMDNKTVIDSVVSTKEENTGYSRLRPVFFLSILIVIIGIIIFSFKYKYDESMKYDEHKELNNVLPENRQSSDALSAITANTCVKLECFEYGNLTALDRKNGLMWVTDANLPAKPLHFKEALEFVAVSNFNQFSGFSNWRLPFKTELLSLMKYSEKMSPAYFFNSHGFRNVMPSNYWSIKDGEVEKPIMVDINSGEIKGKANTGYVWLVRDIKSNNNIVDIENKTITTKNTNVLISQHEFELKEVVTNYFKYVEEGKIDDAINSYSESVRHKINRRTLEKTASNTLKYSIESISFDKISENRSSVRINLYHKLIHGRAEYWDVVLNLTKENDGWKIINTPGKFIRYE